MKKKEKLLLFIVVGFMTVLTAYNTVMIEKINSYNQYEIDKKVSKIIAHIDLYNSDTLPDESRGDDYKRWWCGFQRELAYPNDLPKSIAEKCDGEIY